MNAIVILLIVIAIIGIIYFYKTINSTAAIAYGIYATTVIILWIFLWKALQQFWLIHG